MPKIVRDQGDLYRFVRQDEDGFAAIAVRIWSVAARQDGEVMPVQADAVGPYRVVDLPHPHRATTLCPEGGLVHVAQDAVERPDTPGSKKRAEVTVHAVQLYPAHPSHGTPSVRSSSPCGADRSSACSPVIESGRTGRV
ncbi:hypothetical protein RM543_10370 [Roseicyclus sp. F158]|uniref:Uncharacterized protein n=1 Tax=Tropicimonas omnivorans TaxID=3075590 RepID=A0ABU3DHB9_9RHOB|nr:hypothetical protein [Roseicyclus sp. F158]MDT0683091.1 hypothetical protein [Roseicyclus sp. F158]